MDTWNQRLQHEHTILKDGLKAEKEVLGTAGRLLVEQRTDGAWEEVVFGDVLVGKVEKKGARLAKRIEALMQSG